jgi:hypothetical protein
MGLFLSKNNSIGRLIFHALTITFTWWSQTTYAQPTFQFPFEDLIVVPSEHLSWMDDTEIKKEITIVGTALCREKMCGSNPCMTLVKAQTKKSIDVGGKEVLLKAVPMPVSSHSTHEVFLNGLIEVPVLDREKEQIYLESIDCQEDPELESEIKAEIALQASYVNRAQNRLRGARNFCKDCACSILNGLYSIDEASSDYLLSMGPNGIGEPENPQKIKDIIKNPWVQLCGYSFAKNMTVDLIDFLHNSKIPILSTGISVIKTTGVPKTLDDRLTQNIDQIRISSLIKDPSYELVLSDAEKARYLPIIRYRNLLEKYEIQKKEKTFLAKNVQALDLIFEDLDQLKSSVLSNDSISKALARSSHFQGASFDDLLLAAEKVLSLPTKMVVIDDGIARMARPKLEKILKHFPDDVKKELALALNQIVLNSRLPSTDFEPHKTILQFVGKPGTGKTSVAKGIFEALHLPFIEIQGNIDKKTLQTKLAQALLGAKGKNIAIFLDEIGSSVNALKMFTALGQEIPTTRTDLTNYLLTIFDDSTTTPTEGILPGYGTNEKVYLDISKLSWVLGTNFPFEDEALLQRMKTIVFTKVNIKTRKKIQRNIIKKELKDLDLSEDDLNGDDAERLERIVYKSDETEEGVRVLKEVTLLYLRRKKAASTVPALDLFGLISQIPKEGAMTDEEIDHEFDGRIREKT